MPQHARRDAGQHATRAGNQRATLAPQGFAAISRELREAVAAYRFP
jgi:hypothetical protein